MLRAADGVAGPPAGLAGVVYTASLEVDVLGGGAGLAAAVLDADGVGAPHPFQERSRDAYREMVAWQALLQLSPLPS